MPPSADITKEKKDVGYYGVFQEDESLETIESHEVLAEISENMVDFEVSFDHLQALVDESKTDDIDQSPESCAETVNILRNALSSALAMHRSFVVGAVKKGQTDHTKRIELQRRTRRLEAENRELRGKRGEMAKSLNLSMKKEKLLLEELHTLEEDVGNTTTELKIARAKERKSRKMASEYSMEKKKLETELAEVGKKRALRRARSIHIEELKEDLCSKKTRVELLESQLKSQEAQNEIENKAMAAEIEGYKDDLLDKEASILELRNIEEQYKLDLEMALSELKTKSESIEKLEQRIAEEQAERAAISAQMTAMSKEHSELEAELTQTIEATETKWKEKMMEQERLCDTKEDEIDELRVVNAGLEMEVKMLNEAKGGLIKGKQEMKRLSFQVGETKERLKAEEHRMKEAEQKYTQRIKELEKEVQEGQAERRRMHNIIQELRGNVRVFARIRPFLPGDNVEDDASPCIVTKNDNGIKIRMGEDKPWDHNFAFDAVFPPTAGQEAVFQEASEFIQSALDGYNVCLFSYGQTGSGKTHTMQGCGLGQMRGIIPRAIEQVGKCKTQLENDGWSYEMKVSYLEIYNETIRDLLRDEVGEEVKHEIKLNKDGSRYVSNLSMTQIDPNDPDAIEKVMQQAAMHRSVASTGMNSVSSRSHAVFTLHLAAIHSEQGQALRGQLNLVDLAGSERIKKSNASGDQAKETKAINKSLSSLTDVFVAIGRKGGHIPFRNSKLTYLLQPCLGGEGKTLMLVNLSPTEASAPESLCSLRFASHVNKCELGKAKRSIGDYVAPTDDDATGVVSPEKRSVTKNARTPRSQASTTQKKAGMTKDRTKATVPQRVPRSKKVSTGSGSRLAQPRTKTSSRTRSPTPMNGNVPKNGAGSSSSVNSRSTASTLAGPRSVKSAPLQHRSANKNKPISSKRPSYASVLSQKRLKVNM